ncbi:DYW_deaminase domain-containing protein [Psidium guajava]|nr:DYW_deaminase domain-containing protein [Psidium guajava]
MSNTGTKEECLEKMLFGLPSSHVDFVRRVKAGMILFLFEYEQRELHGVFEAASNGEINIISSAYTSSGKQFPSQVQVSRIWHCYPLSEQEFRGAIEDNYFSANKFNFGLSYDQVHQLLCLFDSRKIRESKDTDFNRCATAEFVESSPRSLHIDGKIEGVHLANADAEVKSSHLTPKLFVHSERTLPEDCLSPVSETMDKSSTTRVSSDGVGLACPSPSQTRQKLPAVETQCANALGSQSIQLCSVTEDNACSCLNADLGDFIPLSSHDDESSSEDKDDDENEDEDEDKSIIPRLWTDKLCCEPCNPIISGADTSVGPSELSTLDPQKVGELSSAIIPLRIMTDHQLKEDNNHLNSLSGWQNNNLEDSDNLPRVKCLYSDSPLPSKKGSVFSRLTKGTIQEKHNPVDVVISVDDIMEKLQLTHKAWMKTAKDENPALKAEAVINSRKSVFKRLSKPLETGASEGQCDWTVSMRERKRKYEAL